jgi:hypothetical protein
MKPSECNRVRLLAIGVLGAAAALIPAAAASAAVTGTNNPTTVANAIATHTGASFTYTVGLSQAGTGNSPLAGFPTLGGTYGLLTSGDAELADTPNSGTNDGDNLGLNDPTRGDANDSITLRIGFNVPSGNSCLLLDYKFFSEEFPEFVNKGFNDGFVAELDQTTWSSASQKISAPLDFAAGYGDQVSVDTVGPTIVDPANAAGTTYDAATATITTKTPVTPGSHNVYLSVFDAGDHIYDSAVFLDNLRFNNEPPSTCKPPDLFGGKAGAKVKGKFKLKGKNLLVPIQCLLPPGATDPCVGKVAVTANASGTSAIAAKKVTIAKGRYSVPPGARGKAKTKLTKAGKALLKKRGRLKAKVRITNTINGVSQTFKVKL